MPSLRASLALSLQSVVGHFAPSSHRLCRPLRLRPPLHIPPPVCRILHQNLLIRQKEHCPSRTLTLWRDPRGREATEVDAKEGWRAVGFELELKWDGGRWVVDAEEVGEEGCVAVEGLIAKGLGCRSSSALWNSGTNAYSDWGLLELAYCRDELAYSPFLEDEEVVHMDLRSARRMKAGCRGSKQCNCRLVDQQ